jgi:hypothetical protein
VSPEMMIHVRACVMNLVRVIDMMVSAFLSG